MLWLRGGPETGPDCGIAVTFRVTIGFARARRVAVGRATGSQFVVATIGAGGVARQTGDSLEHMVGNEHVVGRGLAELFVQGAGGLEVGVFRVALGRPGLEKRNNAHGPCHRDLGGNGDYGVADGRDQQHPGRR